MTGQPAATPPSPQLSVAPAIDAVAPTLSGFVDRDHLCIHCGYSLKGLPRAGHCPECGSPVELSLRGFALAFAAPEYLDTVRSGLTLVLRGIALMFAASIASIVFGMISIGIGASRPIAAVVIQALGMVPSVMLIVGYWRFTRPDLGFLGKEVPTSARRVIRVTVSITAAITLVETLADLAAVAGVGGTGNPALDSAVRAIGWGLALTAVAAWATQFFAVLRYIRWLARRVPDGTLIRRSHSYAWILPVVFILGAPVILIGPLVAVILYWSLLNRLRLQVRAIQLTGLPSRFV